MDEVTRRRGRLLLVVVLAVALCSAPVLGHSGHESHESREDTRLSPWPFFFVFGTVTAGGSLLAGHRFDVPRQYAIGLATGGGAMALVAAVVWFA
ncbi:hypothetical protein L593_10920 [Salinarchaeum sp. Harcht-Bsk1]|uniref:hypothetical protein n=1 Tax=Salinarchaeum sp. Harcht-Bsk1 TaxID=1333523 RepID=UPI0003423150|nr:hypothetical protein [Salinarchaeum sp. Harcht-Bsk1]AGN02129.1 hypothetical protein L593_10920 [Salinarchaeum sp. Harcht-Bsk1]